MTVSRLMAAAVLLAVTSLASAQEESSTDTRVLVYLDEVGGPYFDEWYLQGDVAHLRGLKLVRSGKSGDLSAPVEIDCKASFLNVSGPGLIYDSIEATADELQNYIIPPIVEATLNKACL